MDITAAIEIKAIAKQYNLRHSRSDRKNHSLTAIATV